MSSTFNSDFARRAFPFAGGEHLSAAIRTPLAGALAIARGLLLLLRPART
jgi:hypothetical protein